MTISVGSLCGKYVVIGNRNCVLGNGGIKSDSLIKIPHDLDRNAANHLIDGTDFGASKLQINVYMENLFLVAESLMFSSIVDSALEFCIISCDSAYISERIKCALGHVYFLTEEDVRAWDGGSYKNTVSPLLDRLL
jgi:hypothetical protein